MNFNPSFRKLESNREGWFPVEGSHLFVKRSNGQIEGDWTVSQINNEIITVFKPSSDNPKDTITKELPISELKRINDKDSLDFTEADDFNNLYKLIKFQGGINGNSQKYSPEILIEIIKKVINKEIGINVITRTNNLRFAVEKILQNNQ